jgi:hypothetical protein
MPTINFVTTSMQRPTWLFSVGLEGNQRYWLPAVAAGPCHPVLLVKRKGSRFASHALELKLHEMAVQDGIECVEHLGHLFLPMSWILSVNPDAREFCHAAIRLFQSREPMQVA